MRAQCWRVVIACVAAALAPHSGSLAQAEQPPVRAESSGIAIVGNVEHSCIGDCSIRPEQFQAIIQQSKDLSDAQKKIIDGLERDLSLNKKQVQAALTILGEANIPPERLEAKLIEIAQHFKVLQEQIASAQPGDDVQIVALKADAQEAIKTGNLSKADDLLAKIEAQQRQALNRLAISAAETMARRGDIALTRLQYDEAAKHFVNAAAMLTPGSENENKRIEYLKLEAYALYRKGSEFDDNKGLLAAIDRWKRLLAIASARIG